MESGLCLDSQVEIWRHNIIGHICGIRHVCGTGPISESFIYTKYFPDTAFWLNTVTYLGDGPVPGTNSSGETGNMIQSVNMVVPIVTFCIIPWQNKMILVSFPD